MLDGLIYCTTVLALWALGMSKGMQIAGTPFASHGDVVYDAFVLFAKLGGGLLVDLGVYFVESDVVASVVCGRSGSGSGAVVEEKLSGVLVRCMYNGKWKFVVGVDVGLCVDGAGGSVCGEEEQGDWSLGRSAWIPFCSSLGEWWWCWFKLL